MTHVVTEPCKGCLDKSCLKVCPVDCFFEDDEMVYIHPDECIDCGGCIPECPTEAIFYQDDVPPQWHHYIEINSERSKTCKRAQFG